MLRSFASPSPSTTTPLRSLPLIQFSKPIKLKNSHPQKPSNLALTKTHCSTTTSFHFTTPPEKPSDNNNDLEFNENDVVDDDNEGCPWEGAVLYKRNAGVSHLEYCTTLERLGLEKIASEVSRARASEMGLRVVKSVKEYGDGTPVLISVDVVRKKQKLRLDGIVRTVISLNCNRCGGPAAQSVYSDFSLLLCEEPIKEPDIINMGVIFGEDKFQNAEEDGDEDSVIDWEDQLYFPLDEKVIDISKNIRDLIHLEITITALCDPKCKGLCLKCGTNLNNTNCTCNTDKVDEKGYGPLGSLRKQMQQT